MKNATHEDISTAADAVTRMAHQKYQQISARYSGLRGKVRDAFRLGMKDGDRQSLSDVVLSSRLAGVTDKIAGLVDDMYSVLNATNTGYGLRTAGVQADAMNLLNRYRQNTYN